MTDNSDRKKRKKRNKTRKSSDQDDYKENDDEDVDNDENDEYSDYFQKFLKNLGKQLGGIDISKMMEEFMRQFSQLNPDLKDMSPEDLQKMINENMARMGVQPFVFKGKMTIGKDGIPRFEPFKNKQENSPNEVDIKEEREPLVDIMEEDEEVVIVAEIPGCVKENIELETTDNSLTIIACDEDKVRKYNTTVDLPSKINPDHARARYQNGILEVKLKKVKGRRKGKKISVD
jgi:HSP20 family protein